ncbi:hypothetical protein D3C74_356140 [compost metagenome]
MGMTYSYRQRIGHIIRFRYSRQLEQQLHHFLHLLLLRLAVTDYRLLHHHRCILCNREPPLHSCENQHTACLRDRQCSRYIAGKKQFLYRNSIRLVFINKLNHAFIDMQQPLFLRRMRLSLNGTILNRC